MDVRQLKRRGKSALVIDFIYWDSQGKKQRYRQKARVQTLTAARLEDARLQRLAAETGSPVVREPEPVKRKTLAEFIEPWRTDWAPRHKPSTRERYGALLGQGLLEAFGNKRLDTITTPDAYAYESSLLQRKIRAWPHISLLSSLLKAAVKLGELDRIPELPPIKKPKAKLRSIPSLEEIEQTILLATGWLRVAVGLAVFGGLRSGELRALLVRHVDLPRMVLHIEQAFSADEIGLPKAGAGRDVPIDPRLRPILAKAIQGKRPDAHLVACKTGKVPTRQNVLSKLNLLQGRHGLPKRSVHSLRHAFCTYLLRRGADVESVRIVAGHEDLKTTAQYLHGSIEDARRVMEQKTEPWIQRGSIVDPTATLN